jgi:hypothetical protein
MPGHDDVVMDGLALIEAVHARDLEGGRVLLDHGNTRLLAAFLARLACDLIEGWLLDDDPAAFTALREHYTAR